MITLPANALPPVATGAGIVTAPCLQPAYRPAARHDASDPHMRTSPDHVDLARHHRFAPNTAEASCSCPQGVGASRDS